MGSSLYFCKLLNGEIQEYFRRGFIMKIVLFLIVYIVFGVIAQKIFIQEFVRKFFVDDGKRGEESNSAFHCETIEEGALMVEDAVQRDVYKNSVAKQILMGINSLIFWPILVPFGLYMTYKVWTKECVRKDMMDSYNE